MLSIRCQLIGEKSSVRYYPFVSDSAIRGIIVFCRMCPKWPLPVTPPRSPEIITSFRQPPAGLASSSARRPSRPQRPRTESWGRPSWSLRSPNSGQPEISFRTWRTWGLRRPPWRGRWRTGRCASRPGSGSLPAGGRRRRWGCCCTTPSGRSWWRPSVRELDRAESVQQFPGKFNFR